MRWSALQTVSEENKMMQLQKQKARLFLKEKHLSRSCRKSLKTIERRNR